jgi:SRSO17 transposase
MHASFKHDYALSCASAGTPLSEFARVFNAEHRIEQYLQRAKGEAGLSHYQVRTWRGWYHHQTLSKAARSRRTGSGEVMRQQCRGWRLGTEY